MTDPAPQPPPTCMLCLKQFPADVKAQMKAKAALERKSLRDWMIDVAKRALAQTKKR